MKVPDYADFQVLPDSHHLALMPWHYPPVVATFRRYLPPGAFDRPLRVLDATAHVGCDCANFVLNLGARVTACEVSPAAAACLRANLAKLKIADSVEVVEGSATRLLLGDPARLALYDMIYIDPPWTTERSPALGLADGNDFYTVEVLAGRALAAGCPLVAIKTPPAYMPAPVTGAGGARVPISNPTRPAHLAERAKSTESYALWFYSRL